jgi:hypothetical protein
MTIILARRRQDSAAASSDNAPRRQLGLSFVPAGGAGDDGLPTSLRVWPPKLIWMQLRTLRRPL